MTPKKLEAMLFIASKRINEDRVAEFVIAQTAAHGDKKTSEKLLKDLRA